MTATHQVAWIKDEAGMPEPWVVSNRGKRKAAWAPQLGSQQAFLSCRTREILYYGNRGGGKSLLLLMRFGQGVGQGWGVDWRGVIFRRTYSELSDLIDKAREWFPLIFPGSNFNKTERKYYFPNGETLLFDYFEREEDYNRHHGHAFTMVAFDELSLSGTPYGYLKMMSCLRSAKPGIPLVYCATTNPYGIGSGWIRNRFRLHQPVSGILGPYITDSRDIEGELEPPRRSIRGMLHENKILLHAQPDYIRQIRAAARNEAELRAWLYADWNVISGGMFDDVWDARYSAIPSFPPHLIPRGWKINRGYDHGQSAPFSVGWFAESNGEPMVYREPLTDKEHVIGPVRGDIILFAEWYGARDVGNGVFEGLNLDAIKIGEGIRDREYDMGIADRVRPGPADNQIFTDDPNLEHRSIAGRFAKVGVIWEQGKKGPGSRVQKWQMLRQLMLGAVLRHGYREYPGIFVCNRVYNFFRLIPVAPRDSKNMDDVDTNWEDHQLDMIGYRIFSDPNLVAMTDW